MIVCSENFVVYKAPGQPERRCALPRRKDLPSDHGLLVTAAAVHKQRDLFFILVQSECGDLYKVTLQVEAEAVSELRVRYLDSIPVYGALHPQVGLPLLRLRVWQPRLLPVPGRRRGRRRPVVLLRGIEAGDLAVVEIEPRPLQNLLHVDDIDSLCPHCRLETRRSPQDGLPLHCCPLRPRASLVLAHAAARSRGASRVTVRCAPRGRTIRHGARTPLDVLPHAASCRPPTLVLSIGAPRAPFRFSGSSPADSHPPLALLSRAPPPCCPPPCHPPPPRRGREMAVSELPGNPNAVWTVRKRREDPHDAYIVVSFVNATLVLSIGETVEEVTDSGLKDDTPTLCVALLGDDALVQVHPSGIRHVRADGRTTECSLRPRGSL